MTRPSHVGWRHVLLVPVAALLTAAASAQAQGTVSGRVTGKVAGQPISEARVEVVGTTLVVPTGADGRFTIRNVPSGAWAVRVLHVGFQEQKKSVTMTTGQNVTIDFALEQAVVSLAEVVTTATGEQRRVELGNAVATINASSRAQQAPTTSMDERRTPTTTKSGHVRSDRPKSSSGKRRA